MVDRDIANLYQLETKVLNQPVRNIERFSKDFRFQLNDKEKNELVTNCDRLNAIMRIFSFILFSFLLQPTHKATAGRRLIDISTHQPSTINILTLISYLLYLSPHPSIHSSSFFS